MREVECNMDTCFFCQNSLPEWMELTKLKKQTLQFKKNEVLFTEGSPTQGMYFVQSGTVKVYKLRGQEKALIIRFARAGDIFGLRGFGSPEYQVSAVALEPTEVCFIPTDHLEASLKINPNLCYKLMLVYAKELEQAEQRMSELAHQDVKGRLADLLLRLQDQAGEVSRQDIASYAGTTYETVFKIFTDWSAKGWIETKGKRIRILKKESLEACISH